MNLLGCWGIGLFISGPIAVVLAIVLFNKLGGIHRRLNMLEGKPEYGRIWYNTDPTSRSETSSGFYSARSCAETVYPAQDAAGAR